MTEIIKTISIRKSDIMKEMKLHEFIVSVDYSICCYTEEEAEEYYASGVPIIVHVEDGGEIE